MANRVKEHRPMSVQSLSFWQQDQSFWNQAKSQAKASASSNALISAMGSAVANEAKGLASLANKEALRRTNNALTAAIQAALQQTQSAAASSSGSSTSSSSSSSAAAPSSSAPSPASGTGTVPLSSTTSLLTLGIVPNGTITVSDGTHATTYASTGTDTVGDLINAINNPNIAKNAQVKASLNASGHLVLTGSNDNVSISVGGIFASNIGFGPKNDSFQPTAAVSAAAGSSANFAGSSPAASGASSTTTKTSFFNSAYALHTGGTADFLLASGGSGGTLLNLLA